MGDAKVVIIFYSLYTHTYQLAQAVRAGVESVPGVKVEMYQVPEILPDNIIDKMGATKAKEAMKDVTVITHEMQGDILKSADAIIFGSPTRFGNMTSQMKNFFDGLGGLWYENAFVGKLGSVFGGSGTQHGGQETTLFSMITCLFHLGMIVVGLPYTCQHQKESKLVSGGTPYGSTHIAATDGSRAVSENEKECARFQGRHVATLAKQMKAGKKAANGASVSNNTKEPVPESKNEKAVEKPEEGKKSTKKNKKAAAAGAGAKKPKKGAGSKKKAKKEK